LHLSNNRVISFYFEESVSSLVELFHLPLSHQLCQLLYSLGVGKFISDR
jgi:hypothetical protein